MPLKLNERDLGIIAVGATVIVLILFMTRLQMDDGEKGQPRYEGELGTSGISGVYIESLDTGDHYFHPNHCVPGQDQIFTPHRYPSISGGNITALIHRGFDPMRRLAPQDSDWMIKPPSNEILL
jgi:hypothetical protein